MWLSLPSPAPLVRDSIGEAPDGACGRACLCLDPIEENALPPEERLGTFTARCSLPPGHDGPHREAAAWGETSGTVIPPVVWAEPPDPFVLKVRVHERVAVSTAVTVG